jgi:hypothetical protein
MSADPTIEPSGNAYSKWSDGKKILWNCIECTYIGNAEKKATPHQVRAEVWMSLIHGSTGLIWFVHEFEPKFNEHAILDDPEMSSAVATINKQIHELAPILNNPTIKNLVTIHDSKIKEKHNHDIKRAYDNRLKGRTTRLRSCCT